MYSPSKQVEPISYACLLYYFLASQSFLKVKSNDVTHLIFNPSKVGQFPPQSQISGHRNPSNLAQRAVPFKLFPMLFFSLLYFLFLRILYFFNNSQNINTLDNQIRE